ncbi:MAG: CAP domain-containing protein, partial [Planctomycetota bacterium]|nr:CAP domain-containing protein [Planctomycetota bacterium]
AFGKPLAEVDAEWREWARGDSGVAWATDYGPPPLPEKPNNEELAVLERLNEVRGTALAYSLPLVEGDMIDMSSGTMGPLPPCQLDAEASLACEAHSQYLTMHTDTHLRWPEAHEEDPAHPEFTPRGMRAAMRSVIVFLNADGGVSFARGSVDGWRGTPYHRFPLLEHNINRFGYSYVYNNGWSVATLDMGSLEEPYDPRIAPKLVAWPPPNMKNVPRRFHGREHPNPLGDQPEDQQDITKTGYPISLQLQKEWAGRLSASSIDVYIAKKRGKLPAKNFIAKGTREYADYEARRTDPVAIWKHTPEVPLLKRMEMRDVVFAIPKEPLRPKTTYQVEIMLHLQKEFYFVWEFTTGSQMEGLKF